MPPQQFAEFERQQPVDEEHYSQDYEAFSNFNDYSIDKTGEKISGTPSTPSHYALSPTQRFALAVVSLSLFTFLFFASLTTAIVMPAAHVMRFAPTMGLCLTVLLIVVNVIANRKR